MSSKDVNQLIEKERSKDSLHGIWTNETKLEYDGNEDEIFENCFKETSLDRHLNAEKLPLKTNTISEKAKEFTNAKEDIDSTDYFDSEDEYWENQTSTLEDDYYLDEYEEYRSPSTGTSNTGRYSKGVEQYLNMPIFQRSLRKFAADNDFKVYDVIPDGNCMFRAIADQLLINGCLGHTLETLRQTAVEYLRQHPFQEDKGHPSSFLTEETWDEYLTRMSRPGEWSDHIILQALADVLFLQVVIFNVFHDDVCRTEVNGNPSMQNENRLMIFLGHLGEFHYSSLRPKLWLKHWPYKALILRILAGSKDSKTKKHIITQKVNGMTNGIFISDATLNNIAEYAMHNIREEHPEETNLCKEQIDRRVFRSYGIIDLQLEETEESLKHLVEDRMHIDPLTGIPLTHLSFIMTNLMPQKLKHSYTVPDGHLLYAENVMFHTKGPWCDGCNFTLRDITRTQTLQTVYNKKNRKRKKLVVIKEDKDVMFEIPQDDAQLPSQVYVESSETHHGYCRLKLPKKQLICRDENILRVDSSDYLKAYNIPESLKFVPYFHGSVVQYIGFLCPFPSMTSEWEKRKRNFDFPSTDLVDRIIQRGCTLIPKPHPNSKNPMIEWKYNFSMAEFLIIVNMTRAQQYGYFVMKVLIENLTFQIKRTLKAKHLKAVFLKTCEEMPVSAWDTCFSGCVLHVISKLLSCLKARFLSHYFIPTNNLIDCFSSEDINAISVCIESIRLFPANIVQFVAEKHGFVYGTNLVKTVLSDVPSFMQTKDLRDTVENTLIPTSIRTAKFLSRIGLYEAVPTLLEDMYEQLLLLPDSKGYAHEFQDFIDGVINKMDQRSSRINLAKTFDREYGTTLVAQHLRENSLQLKNLLPWKVDDSISWLKVPESKAVDITSTAKFLYGYSLTEYDKRNVTLSLSTIETAISCSKHAIEKDSLDVNSVEDLSLRKEIIEEIRGLKQSLSQYYIHLYNVSSLALRTYPLINHMSDIEGLCEEFPNFMLKASEMFCYLGKYEKAKEYSQKFITYFSNTIGRVTALT